MNDKPTKNHEKLSIKGTKPSKSADRRGFYRIRDDVGLKYRIISHLELKNRLAQIRKGSADKLSLASDFATTSTQLKHRVERFRRDFPELALYLEALNEKLDVLIRLLSVVDSELPEQPTHNVSLSAGGLRFDTHRAIPENTLLEIQLLIFPSYFRILAFGTVVDCTRSERSIEVREIRPTDAFPYHVGVEFTYIDENDREALIRHVLQKQSSQLRKNRKRTSGSRAVESIS